MACNHGRVAMSVHVSIKTSHCVTSYLRAPWVVAGFGGSCTDWEQFRMNWGVLWRGVLWRDVVWRGVVVLEWN